MDRPWRTLSRLTLVASLAWAILAFGDYGLSWDEEHSARNGEYAVAWYTTLGRDDRVITDFNQRLYGSFFNTLSYLAGRVSPLGPYETGHLVIALFGWIGLVFTYRLATLAGGARAGFFALVFLALTPAYVGHAFMNPKDIPLAALFVAAAYQLAVAVTELPAPSGKTLRRFALATGLAAGVRVIGILPLGYWAFAIGVWFLATIVRRAERPRLWTVAGWWWKPALGAWLVMVLCWPYAQLNPAWNPIDAFLENARFAFQGSLLFDGTRVSPQSLPWTYLPTWFAISLPEFYAIGLAAGVVPALFALASDGRGRRGRAVAAVASLLLLALLPPALAVWRRAVMYDGMRHFLFTLPFLAVLSGWGFASAAGDLGALGASRRPVALLRAAIAAVAVVAGLVSLAMTAADMRALHPYEYIYFNRLVAGGLPSASTRFETDYWGLSYKEGLEWLRDHLPPEDRRVTVANCSSDFLTIYPIRRSPELSARFVASSMYTIPPPTIVLATTRYDCHRRGGTVLHIVERMGVPLAYVLRRDAAPAP